MLAREVGGDRGLPAVAIVEELLLIVQQLLVRLGRVLKVGALDDGVDGARLLAEAAVDALGHVDVVPRRAAAAVLALLRLDGDRLRGADGLAELARDAPLLARGVPAERVLAAEARRQRALLERVVDRHLGLPEVLHRQRHPAKHLREEQRLRGGVQHCEGRERTAEEGRVSEAFATEWMRNLGGGEIGVRGGTAAEPGGG